MSETGGEAGNPKHTPAKVSTSQQALDGPELCWV